MYRKLEACYDQMIQPQKRLEIRPSLELLVIRILEIKEKLIEHNRRPHSTLVHLDDILMDLKLDPRVLEIPVPRWLRDNLQPDDHLKLLNLEEKSEEVPEKAKKGKKGKKGEKDAKTDDEPKLPQTIAEKEAWYKKIIEDNNIPEEEEVADPFSLEMDIVMAIRLIQKNERGRQWRQRMLQIISMKRRTLRKNELMKRIKEGLEMANDEEKEQKANLLIQKRLKGLIARRQIDQMRQNEMRFLGMLDSPKTEEEEKNSTAAKVKAIEEKRKKDQEDAYADFKNAILKMKDIIKLNEEFDIRDKMYDERMLWIIDHRRNNDGKLPKYAADFYKRADVGKPKTEEELANEAAKKGAKGKKAAPKKAGKKKGEKKEVKKEYLWTGPTTDAVIQLEKATENFSNIWEKKDESDPNNEKFDKEMIKTQVRPLVEKEIEMEVDKLIESELLNLHFQVSKKAPKKPKKKPKKKGKKKAKKLPPALKLIAKKTTYELLSELFVLGIAKKLNKEYRVAEFMGDYNYVGSIENMEAPVNDTSLAQIRSMITEWGILPLGSKAIHETITRNYGPIKSMLFLGPQGSGKTLMAKSIASETCSLYLDVSPAIIENAYTEKKGEDKLVASVMRVAKELQPAVIYIDECEMVFPGKKKKGKKKGAKKGKGASRIKSQLTKLKKSYLKKEDRILIVGCTSMPDDMSVPDAQKFFDVHISFPYPDVLNRKNIWKTSVLMSGGILEHTFPLSTLAHITEGYTVGSIKMACEKILTEQRKMAVRFFIISS